MENFWCISHLFNACHSHDNGIFGSLKMQTFENGFKIFENDTIIVFV